MTLYCKKADLVLTSNSGRRTYKPNSTLYFSLTKNYTIPEIENEIHAKVEQILKRLHEIHEGKVQMTFKEDPVQEVKIDKIKDGWAYYNSGVTPICAIIEI
jgi:hypothetical protein